MNKAAKRKQTEFPEIVSKKTQNWNDESNNKTIIKIIFFEHHHV